MPQIPLLLADLESFVAAAFMIVMFIGWIANLASQNKAAGKGHQRPRPPQPQGQQGQPNPIQTEIERFLEQARQATASQRREEVQRRDDVLSSDGVEVISPPRNQPVRRPPPSQQTRRPQQEIWEEQTGRRPADPAAQQKQNSQRKQKQNQQQGSRKKQQNQGKSPRPSETVAGRPVGAPIGSSFEPATAVSRFSSEVGRSSLAQTTPSISSHLKAFTAKDAGSLGEMGISSTTQRAESPAMQLAAMMRSRQGVRDAILLSEIMAKPRALRR